jgi:hypothetical protein
VKPSKNHSTDALPSIKCKVLVVITPSIFVGKFIENPSQTEPAFLNYTMQVNQLFFANVYVGAQGQRMKMLLDTCSSVSI